MTFLCKEDSTKIFNLCCDDKIISSLSILKDLLLIVFSIFLYWIYLGRKTYTEIETMMKMLIIFNLICLCCENYAAYITDESMCNGQKSFMLAMVIICYNITLISVVMNKLRGRIIFVNPDDQSGGANFGNVTAVHFTVRLFVLPTVIYSLFSVVVKGKSQIVAPVIITATIIDVIVSVSIIVVYLFQEKSNGWYHNIEKIEIDISRGIVTENSEELKLKPSISKNKGLTQIPRLIKRLILIFITRLILIIIIFNKCLHCSVIIEHYKIGQFVTPIMLSVSTPFFFLDILQKRI